MSSDNSENTTNNTSTENHNDFPKWNELVTLASNMIIVSDAILNLYDTPPVAIYHQNSAVEINDYNLIKCSKSYPYKCISINLEQILCIAYMPAAYFKTSKERNIYMEKAQEHFTKLFKRELINMIHKTGLITYEYNHNEIYLIFIETQLLRMFRLLCVNMKHVKTRKTILEIYKNQIRKLFLGINLFKK